MQLEVEMLDEEKGIWNDSPANQVWQQAKFNFFCGTLSLPPPRILYMDLPVLVRQLVVPRDAE